MIPYRPKSSLLERLELAFMAGLLILAAIQIACCFSASGTVAQKDMQISSLLDVKKPVVVAEQ